MLTFEAKVRDKKGRVSTRVMRAASAGAARIQLRQANLVVVGIKEREGATAARGAKPAPGDLMYRLNMLMEGKVKLKELTVFSRQFATMINAGVSLVRALDILTVQTESKRLQRILGDVKDQVEQGQPLSDSLARHPETFSTLYQGMVRAGEAGGVLDSVVSRVAGFLENQHKLNQQVKSAMAYPSTVMVFAMIISFVMLKFIVPVFDDMFKQMDAKLPPFTQGLVDLSNFMGTPGAGLAVLAAIGAVYGFLRFKRTEKGAYVIDKYMLKLPIAGDLIRKVAVARFSRTLGTLLKSGVPLLGALEIVRDSIGNRVVSETMESLRVSVSEGESLAKPLEKAKVFPAMVTQMVAIGEETGAIDAMLEKVADFYDTEVEAGVKALTSMLEPLMMVVIGGIVGSIIIGMYLPIFSIVENIK